MSHRAIHHSGDTITGVAVAIRREEAGNTHTGVLCRHEDGRLFIIHLRWDCDLAYEQFDGTFAWAVPNLLAEEENDIRGICRALYRYMPDFHYSFRFDHEAKLDPSTAQLISDNAPYGLTCSTFVMAVFKSAEVQLVNPSSWPERDDDIRWYQRLLSMMGRTDVDPAHIAKVEKDIKTVRVRPEEAVGACMESLYPVNFTEAHKNGVAILSELDEKRNKTLNRYSKDKRSS